MDRVMYHLDSFVDEVMPAMMEGPPTLENWAKWLAGGGERANPHLDPDEENCWAFDPPADGTEYAGGSLTFDEDVIASRHADGEITYSRPIPADIDFVALRYGYGMGWDCDMILDTTEVTQGLLGYPEPIRADHPCPALAGSCALLDKGESGYLAIGRNANLTLVYRTDPPRLEIVEAVAV